MGVFCITEVDVRNDFRKKMLRQTLRAHAANEGRANLSGKPHRLHVNEISLLIQFYRNDWSADNTNRSLPHSTMPAGDVELLRYRSLSDINGDNSIRRAQSEASVHECGVNLVGFSMLKLSKTRLTVGDSVTVYWDIHDTCSCNDWIGLFDLGESQL